VSRQVSVEGGLRYSKPVLDIRISGDAEDAPDVTAEETLNRYVVDGSVLWHLTQLSFAGGRGVPFLSGGVGYLRELHENDELVETGTEYHAGGGVTIWFGTSRRRWGIRGDAGFSIRDGGFDFEEGRRTMPIASGSVVYRF
jgi:hypothetical protein